MKRHGGLISIVRATATAKKEVCRDRGCLTGGTGCRKSEIFHQLLGHKFEKNRPSWQEYIVPTGRIRVENNSALGRTDKRDENEDTIQTSPHTPHFTRSLAWLKSSWERCDDDHSPSHYTKYLKATPCKEMSTLRFNSFSCFSF